MKQIITKLELALAALGESLVEETYLQACLYKIPPVLAGCESEEINLIAPEEVGVSRLKEELGQAFTDLYIQKPYSQKSSRRYPGVIQYGISESSLRLVQLVQTINQLKQDIQDTIVKTYSTRGDRFRAMHEACPGGMTMHIYRSIHLLQDQSVNSLRFTWQKKEVVATPNKKQLLEQIAAVYASTEPSHQLPLMQLLDSINKVAENKLRVRRPVKVQPAANLVLANKKLTLNAPLPIIIIQDEMVQVSAVPRFDASVTRKPRSDKKPNIILGTFNGFQIEATEL